MKIKYQLFIGSLVGRSPYQDHQIILKQNIFWKRVGLDTPLKEYWGYPTNREFNETH
jgi:hypothetical protein